MIDLEVVFKALRCAMFDDYGFEYSANANELLLEMDKQAILPLIGSVFNRINLSEEMSFT